MPLVKHPPQDGFRFSSDDDRGSSAEKEAKEQAEKSGEFTVLFFGGYALGKKEKDVVRRQAHEEFYREKMGREPAGEATNADLRHEIEKAVGHPVDIRIHAIRINPQDPTGSFINHMKDLGKFLNESRRRFLNDALKELDKLAATPSQRGDDISKDKFQLCRALLQAYQDQGEFFDSNHETVFDDLRRNLALKPLFRSAEGALIKAGTGSNQTKFSDGHGRNSEGRGE